VRVLGDIDWRAVPAATPSRRRPSLAPNLKSDALNSSTSHRKTATFLRDFTEHSREIYRYIRTILPHQDRADDVFQETSIVLWEKCDQFEPGTSFLAWARKIAHFKVLENCKRHARDPLVFGTECVEAIARTAEQVSPGQVDGRPAEERRRLLADCFEKLAFRDRQIVERRYKSGATTASIAEELGRPTSFVYRILRSAHESLFHCIQRGLAEEGTGR
jgi:RNA polymerase sigma-70 factor (ECF subfamily)